MASALAFSEDIVELTVGGPNAPGADILAKTIDGKLIAREVSVFQGDISNIYRKMEAEAGQIGKKMTQELRAILETQEVFIQVTDELANNREAREKMRLSALNLLERYDEYGERLRITVVDPRGNEIVNLINR